MSPKQWLSQRLFTLMHGQFLVFNTCWEDPRADRQALDLGPDDTVLVITSAGCNALDYALCEPRRIHAVDLNPRQNSLLELKQAAIRALDYPTFFQMFGCGRLERAREIYAARLRHRLQPVSQRFWDRKIGWFSGSGLRRSFYFHGTTGLAAWTFRTLVRRTGLARAADALLECGSLAEQRTIFEASIRPRLRRPGLRWLLSRDTTLSLLGTPPVQRRQLERSYHGGIAQFIEDCLEAVFTRLPLADNYFWRVYMTGAYTPDCCPEYLKEENFGRLQAGLVDRVSVHTSSVLDFLTGTQETISRFVLLDHMDWLSASGNPLLRQQWQAILARASDGARVIWRSGGLGTEFIDDIPVVVAGRRRPLGEVLKYNRPLAARLHAVDRPHTYGSLHIATLPAVVGRAVVSRPHFLGRSVQTVRETI